MWESMESLLTSPPTGMSEQQREMYKTYGADVSLRLRDKSVRHVCINWQGVVYFEHYLGMGYVGNAGGPPTFAAEDIESWGHQELIRKPSWRHPLKRVAEWKVRVWVDGRMGTFE